MTFTADSSQETAQARITKGRYTDDLPPTPKIKAQIVECECAAFACENGAYTVLFCSRHEHSKWIDAEKS